MWKVSREIILDRLHMLGSRMEQRHTLDLRIRTLQKSDPNRINGNEIYLGILLGEGASVGSTRGEWIDISPLSGPGIYQCCTTDFSTCPLA